MNRIKEFGVLIKLNKRLKTVSFVKLICYVQRSTTICCCAVGNITCGVSTLLMDERGHPFSKGSLTLASPWNNQPFRHNDNVNRNASYTPEQLAEKYRQPRSAGVSLKRRSHLPRPAQCLVCITHVGAHACRPTPGRITRPRTTGRIALILRAALPRCIA